MNILLVAFNARFTHSSLAIRYLRNALLSAGAESVSLSEFWITQDRISIIQAIVVAQPDVLMLSVQVWNSELVAGLLPDLKRLLPECRLILGGPEVSYNARAWLDLLPMIDLIVCGAGEAAMTELAQTGFAIAQLAPDRIMRPKLINFVDLQFPYTREDFAQLKHHYLYYESSRGCPFACSYCLSSRDDQPQVFKSAATTCSELDMILAQQVMLVKFVDRTFNADPQRSRIIWRHLIEHYQPETSFHFEIHPAMLEEADFDLLKSAPHGLFQFEIGVQSVNPKSLASISRPVNWAAVREGVRRLIELEIIHIHLDLIVGLPHEGLVEIGASFDAIVDLAPHHFQMGFLKGLHGTVLREQADHWHMVFSQRPPYQILCNQWLSVADLAELSMVEQLVDNAYNSHHLDYQLREAVQHFGSAFVAFRNLAAYCRHCGFDVRTRHAGKLQELYQNWQQGWAQNDAK